MCLAETCRDTGEGITLGVRLHSGKGFPLSPPLSFHFLLLRQNGVKGSILCTTKGGPGGLAGERGCFPLSLPLPAFSRAQETHGQMSCHLSYAAVLGLLYPLRALSLPSVMASGSPPALQLHQLDNSGGACPPGWGVRSFAILVWKL